ncbi:PREDICTED: cation channel sperm-associated protein 3-like [Priapulus caudatus]|uniref:Cation channel sperm-associated protein 3-like n=1 Tax=Priapulus caudatus TaxID=37621 RepID=A0ABM1EB63_PRICU|nr:PREDICTED: cation channel sperm-associated protein 3-like [Priapulus caudatus]
MTRYYVLRAVCHISQRALFTIADEVFLAIYTVEFILKIYAEPKNYWKSSYNLFDVTVLAISWIQMGLSQIESDSGGNDDSQWQALRILRVLRTLRTLRTISFIRGLQVLVTALMDTIRTSVINIIMLLLLMMFLFAIMGYYFFGYKADSDKEHWGTLGDGMLTLFTFVTVDGWTDLQNALDSKNQTGSRYYTVLFIFLGHFIFTNVFIGVIIMNISEATESYENELRIEREAIVKHKKMYMIQRQHQDVQQMMQKQASSNYKNFNDMVEDFQNTLRHDDYIMMVDMCTNLTWMETLSRTLDHIDNTMYRLQQLQFEIVNLLAHQMETKLKKRYGL